MTKRNDEAYDRGYKDAAKGRSSNAPNEDNSTWSKAFTGHDERVKQCEEDREYDRGYKLGEKDRRD